MFTASTVVAVAGSGAGVDVGGDEADSGRGDVGTEVVLGGVTEGISRTIDPRERRDILCLSPWESNGEMVHSIQ